MNNSIIKLEQINKIFNKGQPNEVRALQNVSLNISQNSVVLLQGPSGSGKTTLLTILGALRKPSSGRVECLEQDLSHWPEKFLTTFRRQHIGIIFQNFQLIKNLTVFQNIAAALIPLSLSAKEINQKVLEVSRLSQIEHRLYFKAGKLSGGEQQRTAIARALIQQPEIIIADEPTAHLDSKLSLQIMDIFKDLKKHGKTIIIAAHDPALSQSDLIDQSFCIRDGKLEPQHVC